MVRILTVYTKFIGQQTNPPFRQELVQSEDSNSGFGRDITLLTSDRSSYQDTTIYSSANHNVRYRIWYYAHNGPDDTYWLTYEYNQSDVVVAQTEINYRIQTKEKIYTEWFFEAIKEEVTIFILYNLNGGTNRIGGSEGNRYYSHDNSFTLPTNITKTGYTLSGFEGPFNGIGQPGTVKSINVRGNPNITANWTIKQYTLDYTGGGTLSGGTPAGDYNYNTTIDLPTTKEKTGHTFSHFTNNNGDTISGDSFSLPASDTTVIANWTTNIYELTYNTNGGTLNGGSPEGNYYYDEPITLPAAKTKTGHTFNNFTNNNGEIISGTSFTVPASNTTVTANWTINIYELTYNTNGGTLNGGSSEGDYNYNTTIDLPTTKEKTGHTFNNFTNNNGNIISGTSFSLPASNTTVTANWTTNIYELTYNTNGGTLNGGSSEGDYNYNTTIDLPTTKEKTGHTFNNFTINGNIISGDSFSLPASNTTVIANWTIKQYTVTYLSIPDHFDFTSTPILYDYNTLLTDTTIDISTPRVIGEVYSFEKWTYGGSDLGDSRLPTENINLVANWNSTDKDEIQMSELSSVFDPSSSFQNIKISNYFDSLKLNDSSQRENVDFFNKLKGRGTF